MLPEVADQVAVLAVGLGVGNLGLERDRSRLQIVRQLNLGGGGG